VEGPLGGGGGEHAKGLLVEAAEGLRAAAPLQEPVLRLDQVEEAAAGDESALLQTRGRGDGVRRLVVRVRCLAQLHWVEARPEEAGVRAGVGDAVVADG